MSDLTKSASCDECGRRWTRWHSVKLEKICDESRHFAWDSGKHMSWCWRVLIGRWIFSISATVPFSDKRFSFCIGRLTYGK